MATEINTFQEFCQNSARRYLSTVVVVDDRIHALPPSKQATKLDTPKQTGRKPALKSSVGAISASPLPEELSASPQEADFQDIQNSFAKHKTICSLYQPKKGSSFGARSTVYGICSAADVVILDWDIYGDQGTKAKELVTTLITESLSEVPHQLRLVLIYTLEHNLGAISDEVYEALVERVGEKSIAVSDGDELTLMTANARVVILGKRSSSLAQYEANCVTEKDLPERVIAEFGKLTPGLLQSIVLLGLSAVRENTRRVFSRFGPELDVAFLTHRSILLPEEALAQIVPLIVDELSAILEDAVAESPFGVDVPTHDVLAGWCSSRWTPISSVDASVSEFLQKVLCKGPEVKAQYSTATEGRIRSLVDSIEDHEGELRWGDKKRVSLAKLLVESHENGEEPHRLLSALMSQRANYTIGKRVLRLGQVLRRSQGSAVEFLLCLQPLCDSVRLRGTVPFLFCAFEAGTNDRFSHLLEDARLGYIPLMYKPKIAAAQLIDFRAAKGYVTANETEDSRFIFQSVTGDEFEWVAELKLVHALKAAEDFSRLLSRVGLMESEWLRLKSKG